jgi:mono/diheme cytochrome c family protein
MLLFAAFAGLAFTLAKLHPAKPGVPSGSGGVKLGDQYNGQTVFSQKCASCHGSSGVGGGIGPKLVGLPLSLVGAKAQIDQGGAAMPAGIVSGNQEADVLAYLATILKSP